MEILPGRQSQVPVPRSMERSRGDQFTSRLVFWNRVRVICSRQLLELNLSMEKVPFLLSSKHSQAGSDGLESNRWIRLHSWIRTDWCTFLVVNAYEYKRDVSLTSCKTSYNYCEDSIHGLVPELLVPEII